MKASVEPRFTPHLQHPSNAMSNGSPQLQVLDHKPYNPLHKRLNLAREIYRRIGGDLTAKKPLKDSLDEAARRKVKQQQQLQQQDAFKTKAATLFPEHGHTDGQHVSHLHCSGKLG